MAEITAQMVSEFRKRTGLGLMECKGLLKEAEGDLKKAEVMAREKGVLKAASRAGRAANAGRIEVAFAPGNTSGSIIELNCETDFVARNDAFRQAARELAEQVLKNGGENILKQPNAQNPSQSVAESLTELNSRTGENIQLARAVRFEGPGRVEAYVHHDSKSGALLQVSSPTADLDALGALARDLALQVVATKPIAVSREAVDPAILQEQKQIFLSQVNNSMGDKPASVREKIATGKLDAWFREITLLDQEFVKDPSRKISDVVAAVGSDVTVVRFVRFVVGEVDPSTPSA